jgi:glycerophosphoryl diester phosphodiesterase
LLIAAGIATVVVIALTIAWPWLRIYSGAAPPEQFYGRLSPSAGMPTRQVLGVAHNAGNHAWTTATALSNGADVIEIDVIKVRGGLAAGRAYGWPWLAGLVFQGPSLSDAWRYAAPAKIIQLDLQQTDRGVLDAVVSFLHDRPGRAVAISTRDAGAIEYLRARLPVAAMLLFSVPFPHAVARIRSDRALANAVDGLSVFQGLVGPDLVRWAHQRGLRVLAWTVNDGSRLNQLLQLGVDGVTTDNLAVLEALSG